MSNSSPDLSRRDFFKVSAAAIATVGVANFLKPSYATEVNVKTVALHPLRSATHRRLGEPLPHQLANAPRAHLIADCSFNCYFMRSYNLMRY